MFAALGSMMGGGGLSSSSSSSTGEMDTRTDVNAGNIHIGGLTIGKTKGIDLKDPATAVMVGGGVILFGAILLAAVRKK